jgi:transcriptional regulator with XRE-family HTH domain
MHINAMKPELNIKKLREARGWTRQEMANHFGVNLTTVLRWENNGIPLRGSAKRAIELEFIAHSEASSTEAA